MRFLSIINPFASRGRALKLLPRLQSIVARTNHTFDWRVTQSSDEMQAVIADAAQSGIDGVILVGGDGTVSSALPALLSTGLPLGVIPCGRGNDFVRNAGLPLNPLHAAVYPDRPEIRSIDIPAANGRPFGSIACLGLDARINELANKPVKYFPGRSAFVYATLKAMRHFEPFDVTVTLDGHVWHSTIMMAAIANGPSYGGGMKIAPKANMEDGRLNLCIVRRTGKWTMLKEFPGVFKGKHTQHPNVISLSAKAVTITSETDQKVFADGENIGQLPLTCSIGEHHLNIMQPMCND
ncbi:MAG: diacylglycerol kinase family lipid kinase [Candidatus Zixiibacteriota bacterium]|nr:MAG: diacylglycerol kinase family lipid kinase [candidate division Zixibacteria bacterium]